MTRQLNGIRKRLVRWSLVLSGLGTAFSGGCLDSEIAKRFREAVAPGLGTGLNAAVTSPDQAEVGLREVWSALNDGLVAIMQPRNSSQSQSGNSSSGQ